MSRELPARPNFEHLKKQAKELLQQFERGDSAAIELFGTLGSPQSAKAPKLADAQRLIAREYGFESWAALKSHVAMHSGDDFEALAAAIKADETSVVLHILKSSRTIRAKINDPLEDQFGARPLMVAVQHGNREMIEALLAAGADINRRSDWWAGSFGVLDGAASRKDWLPAFLIERGARLDPHAAAKLGMLDELKAMIAADPAAVHWRGGDGQTPLHVAATVEIAVYLLAHGADINARDIDHESTPAQYLIRESQDVARYLVKRGCRTDILMAAALGDIDLVRKYLDSGSASIRTSVSAEFFPMQNPRAGGTIYIWTLGKNKTAHMIAREFHHEDVFELLMERSPNELKLSQACELGDEKTFKFLLARNPNLLQNLTDDDRRKLINVAEANNLAAVRLMLEAGFPADVGNLHGVTAWHWAAFHGNAEIIRELLKRHAVVDTSEKNFNGTPMDWAIHGSVHGWHRDTGDYPAVVKELLDAGAKLPEKYLERGSEPVREYLRKRLATGK